MNLSDLNPRAQAQVLRNLEATWGKPKGLAGSNPAEAASQTPKAPLLNKTEKRWCSVLEARGYKVMKQAITLKLDPPFTSYRPDLAVLEVDMLVFYEVKAPHRFARAGIAKAACAAKTYPGFTFRLAMWTKEGWKESVLTP